MPGRSWRSRATRARSRTPTPRRSRSSRASATRPADLPGPARSRALLHRSGPRSRRRPMIGQRDPPRSARARTIEDASRRAPHPRDRPDVRRATSTAPRAAATTASSRSSRRPIEARRLRASARTRGCPVSPPPAFILWLLGYPDRAVERSNRGVALALARLDPTRCAYGALPLGRSCICGAREPAARRRSEPAELLERRRPITTSRSGARSGRCLLGAATRSSAAREPTLSRLS